MELLDIRWYQIKLSKTLTPHLSQQGSKPPEDWLWSFWNSYEATDMETRNTGFFYVNAVELKMKVFMTCKVPLSTPHFGRNRNNFSAWWPCRPCHQEILLIWWALSPSCTIHSVLKRFVMCTLHYELCNRSNSLRIMDYAQCRTQYALSNLHCALCSIQCILSYLVCTKLFGTGRGAKTENGKLPKGRGGVIYNPKIYVAYFLTL